MVRHLLHGSPGAFRIAPHLLQSMSPDPVIRPPAKETPREQGRPDYFRHKGQYRNPHPSGSTDFNEYERGWMQSLKRDEGKLVPAPPMPSQARRPPSNDYNAYAELKGRSSPRK
jgi:hypothetical protein